MKKTSKIIEHYYSFTIYLFIYHHMFDFKKLEN